MAKRDVSDGPNRHQEQETNGWFLVLVGRKEGIARSGGGDDVVVLVSGGRRSTKI